MAPAPAVRYPGSALFDSLTDAVMVYDERIDRLVYVNAGAERVFRVNRADELPDDITGTVGVTAGASAPEELVDEVLARLAPRNGVELVHVTDEDEYFPPPRNIRELQAAIATSATVLLGGALGAVTGADDRHLAARTVLRALDA